MNNKHNYLLPVDDLWRMILFMGSAMCAAELERIMKKQIPTRAEGWKYAGAAGRFTVWHAGKCDYRITDGIEGEVIAARQQFGQAHSFARARYQTA